MLTWVGHRPQWATSAGEVAELGLRALLAGSLVNLANAAIAGVVAA